MKRALTIAAGAFGGLLLTGIVAPALVAMAPPRLRGEPLLIAAAALIVAVTTFGSWLATSDRP